MQSLILMVIYILTTAAVQFIGFLISRLVDYQWPTGGLMTFLALFMISFFVAWPVAVRIAEGIIRKLGWSLETEQSGGALRQDHLARRAR